MQQFMWFLIFSLFATQGFAETFPPEEENQIKSVINSFYDDANKHEPKKMAEFFTTDGDIRTPWSDRGTNRDEVEKILTTEFTGMMKNAHFENNIQSIRMVKPDVAFVDMDSVIKGMETNASTQYAPTHHHVIFVLVKRGQMADHSCSTFLAE